MTNPTKINWTQPQTNEDGSVFDATQFAGFQLLLDGQPAVAIPTAWQTSGVYSFPLASLSLAYGAHTVELQTVAKNGTVSAPSNQASFTLKDERVPKAPLGVTAA